MSKRTLKRLAQQNKVVAVLSKVINKGDKDEKKLYDIYQLR